MKSKFLLPSRFKSIGWLIFIPSIVLGFLTIFNQWEPAFLDMPVFAIFIDEFMGEKRLMGMLDNNILNEILGVLAMVSGLMVAFSRERDEDELISKIRLESLVWATYWNYGILILAMILVYDMAFFCNDSFWLAAPYKTFDNGVSRTTVDTEDGQGLLVEYSSGGVTPGDAYLYTFDDQGRPKNWKLWVSIIPVGGLSWTWEDYKTMPQGCQIATLHQGLISIEINDLATAQTYEELGQENPFGALY